MDEINRERIKQFINDRELSQTVYNFLLNNFLCPKEKDVQTLAAQMLAVDALVNAWREMSGFQSRKQSEKEVMNIGL